MNAIAAKEAIDLGQYVGNAALERDRARLHRRGRRPACAARSGSSTRSRRLGAEKLWRLLAEEDYVNALGALTGGQAVQMAKAGLKAIYLSGWQVAADGNLAAAGLSRPEPLPGRTACRRWCGG